jgi:hypothetical protein
VTATAPPHSPRRDDAEALIEEAWQHARRRQRRRRAAILAGIGLAAALALVWAAVSDGGAAPRDSAGRAGGAADARGRTRYRYTRALISSGMGAGAAASPGPVTIENWVGTDGSWRLRATVPGSGPGSLDVVMAGDDLLPPQTNASGSFDGVPFNSRNPGDGLFTSSQVASLPTDAGALASALRRAVTAQDLRNLDAYLGPGRHSAAQLRRLRRVFLSRRVSGTLLAIADLDMTVVPGSLVYALYRVARELPGVRVTATGHGAHRSDVTITAQGYSMTFDDRTGALRSGSTGVFFDQGSAGTIVVQGTVPNLDAIPKGVAPIQSPVARPPTIAITPRAGIPTTTFRLQMRLNNIPGAATTATAVSAEMFGPTGPNCVFWSSRPPFARVPPGTISRSAPGALANYQITPETIGRRTWCPGRYQLMLNRTTTNQDPSAAPRSFAAVYFEIR